MVHVHGGSGAGATMAPEGKDNIKGEACLGCKRNGKERKIYGKRPGHNHYFVTRTSVSL